MSRRYMSVWFYHLTTDRFAIRNPQLKSIPFVLATPERGRMIVKAVNKIASQKGICTGMVVADARAVLPEIQVWDHQPELASKLLNALAEWCLRFTPIACIDLPDGLFLDITGCTHLWGGEKEYLTDILSKLRTHGYHLRAAIADTIGTAWAISRYGKIAAIIDAHRQTEALLPLPPSALRVERQITEKLEKLGLSEIRSFINMPRAALRRRFGQSLLTRLDQALGNEIEIIQAIQPIEAYQERLPSFEPIRTATGIEIALKQLLQTLCKRLAKEEKGLRSCVLKCYRIDGNIQQIQIGTIRPSRNESHLYKLFEIKIPTIEPALGFELFLLEAPIVENQSMVQEALWETNKNDNGIAELLDRISSKIGVDTIHRYLPDEHYLPERSLKLATSLQEKPASKWRKNIPRPLQILSVPEQIEVTVAIPDYPPILFHYKGVLHRIRKADGPERIEQEWWLQQGLYRDYYCVEDDAGRRYWLFRLGHYHSNEPKWFLHGFFA